MKKQNTRLFLSLIILTILGIGACDSKEELTADLLTVEVTPEYKKVNLSEIIESIQVIPLKTSSELLIPRVADVAYSNEYLIISDARSIYRFSTKGEFINQIGSRGQGPGEFRSIKSMAVDWDREQVFLAGDFKIMCYKFDGSLIWEKKAAVIIEAIHITQEGLQVIVPSFGKKKSASNKLLNEVFLINLNKEFDFKDSITIRSTEVDQLTGATMPVGLRFISEVGSDKFIYFPVPFKDALIRDTLYQLKDDKLIPSLKLDMGVRNKEETRLIISSIVKTPDYLFSTFGINRKARQLLYHFKSGITHQVIDGFEDDVHNTGNASLTPLNTAKNLFYYTKEGIELEGIMEGASSDDNPYLFIVELKKGL